MQVEFIQLKHTALFRDIQLNFEYQQTPITLILGNQSVGKTALLRSIYQALTWFPARYRDIRTAGLVMLDQDIMQHRLQSKIDIRVKFPEDIGGFPENSDNQVSAAQQCSWQLYKTLNAQGVGISKVETQQLEMMIGLYQKALMRDPALGLPLIAYYPAERFVNDVNLLSKNNHAIFQTAHAYEISAIPFTTFTRFFEWFREISDIENAQTAQMMQQLLDQTEHRSGSEFDALAQQIQRAQTKLHAPSLKSLINTLKIIFPELSEIYLQYHPKIQLMVTYQGKTQTFQQLSNSIRNWIALVGDVVRRLCVLNPKSLFPCQEGTGILLVDEIDHQLDQDMASIMLPRLHQAFPCLQIIATGNRVELLEQAQDFQCLKLEDEQLKSIQFQNTQPKFDQLYAELGLNQEKLDLLPDMVHLEAATEPMSAEDMLQLIQQQLSADEQQQLLSLLKQDDPEMSKHPL